MRKILSVTFLALATTATHADTPNGQGSHQSLPDVYTIEDIECSTDARVMGRDNRHCIHKVPPFIFENMCLVPLTPHQVETRYALCPIRGEMAEITGNSAGPHLLPA